jgi:class 3 adenylate cyclase
MRWNTSGMDIPEAHYARSGGVSIAYQVVGDGPCDLVYSPHLADIYSLWSTPRLRSFLDRIADEVRLIVFNPRGTGLSDRPQHVTLEARMDDIGAVMEAVMSKRATLWGLGASANACALFSATYPERCDRLVIARPYPRGLRSASYPYGATEEQWHTNLHDVREGWGTRAFLEAYVLFHEPALADDHEELDRMIWQARLAVSPSGAADFTRMGMETDITDVLRAIRVPTLLLHREEERGVADYMRERIHDVQVVELPSRGVYTDEVADVLIEFVRGESRPAIPESVLATVLFTDLVESTERAAALGDRGWREVLKRHHAGVRSELVHYRGREVDSAGDGFFCRFDGPARAIACAQRIVEGASELGLQVRAGIHTGECELVGEKIAGIAVVTGSRITSLAASGEVLVSSTVKDLVAGSGFAFEDRGEHELKGVPGTWKVHAVVSA